MTEDRKDDQTTSEALQEWRAAERTVAVARRGRLAASVAADAAEEAAKAALATAEAARAALASATLAETSAARTATMAKLVVQSTTVDFADADAETSMAEVDEAIAQENYRRAQARADERSARNKG